MSASQQARNKELHERINTLEHQISVLRRENATLVEGMYNRAYKAITDEIREAEERGARSVIRLAAVDLMASDSKVAWLEGVLDLWLTKGNG